MRFSETELREEAWDPLAWVYVLGDGIFPLLAREFAPLADRLTERRGAARGMPAVTDAARETLVGAGPDRPVGRFHTETALEQLAGVAELIDEALAAAEAAAPDDPARRRAPARLDAAAAAAKAALDRLRAPTSATRSCRERGRGPPRSGRCSPAKLRHTLRSETLTPERILAAAEREYAAVRAEMVRLAREPGRRGAATSPSRPTTAAPRPRRPRRDRRPSIQAPATLLDSVARSSTRIEAFCRERDVIGLADEPLDIRWTPVFLRSFGGAMLDLAGAARQGPEGVLLDHARSPTTGRPSRRESYLREDNDRMLRLLTIHEAVPGHYLQGVYANRSPSLPRAIFGSGLFAEGWAVYVTQVMMDLGLRRRRPGAPAHPLEVLPARRHQRDHRRPDPHRGMTEDEAVALMVDGGFQEEAEARAKYNRARLTSTQLSTYFAGSMEMWDIELEARRRAAARPAIRRGARCRPAGAAGRLRRDARASATGPTSSRSSRTALRRRRCSAASSLSGPAG